MNEKEEQLGEIILYQPEGSVKLEVRVENETVWLTQAQMAELFSVKEHTITYHIQDVLKSDELEQVSTTRKIRVVRMEGKRVVSRNIDFYNLDMIISVGYRVNSKAGVRFRRWANQVLKDFLLKGYAINQRKISTDLQIADRLHEQRQLIERPLNLQKKFSRGKNPAGEPMSKKCWFILRLRASKTCLYPVRTTTWYRAA